MHTDQIPGTRSQQQARNSRCRQPCALVEGIGKYSRCISDGKCKKRLGIILDIERHYTCIQSGTHFSEIFGRTSNLLLNPAQKLPPEIVGFEKKATRFARNNILRISTSIAYIESLEKVLTFWP